MSMKSSPVLGIGISSNQGGGWRRSEELGGGGGAPPWNHLQYWSWNHFREELGGVYTPWLRPMQSSDHMIATPQSYAWNHAYIFHCSRVIYLMEFIPLIKEPWNHLAKMIATHNHMHGTMLIHFISVESTISWIWLFITTKHKVLRSKWLQPCDFLEPIQIDQVIWIK